MKLAVLWIVGDPGCQPRKATSALQISTVDVDSMAPRIDQWFQELYQSLLQHLARLFISAA